MKTQTINKKPKINVGIIAIIIVAIGCILLVLSSCKLTEKKKAYYRNLLCKDSVNTVINNVPIEIPIYYEDSTYSILWLTCNEQNQVEIKNAQYYKGKYTDILSKLDSNKLVFRNRTILKDTIIYVKTDTTIYIENKVPVEKPFKKWDSFLMVCGYVFWGCIIILILFFIGRFLYRKYVLKK